jgi:uncharacterized delta-60 repeat protein
MALQPKLRFAVLVAALAASLAVGAGTAAAAPGDLDAAFADGGRLTFAPGGKQSEIDDVAVQADGKLVLAGWIDKSGNGGDLDFLVVRLNTNGTFDRTFGADGIATMSFPAKGTSSDTASGVAIQPDGKIVVAGTAHDNNQGADRVAIGRFNADGTPDASFNPAGFPNDGPPPPGEQLISINASANDVALDSRGRILVAGGWSGGALFLGIDAYVLRLRADGTQDPTFNGGAAAFHFGFGDASDKPESVSRIAVQPDGKIVLAGFGENSANQDAALARVSPGAVLDPDYGSGGTIVFGDGRTNDSAQDLTLEPDGHILVAGAGFQPNSMMLVRSSPPGPFEKWFNDSTIVSVDFGKPAIANAVALQSNGKIVLGGSAGDDVAVARVQSTGAPDTGFGPDGKRTIILAGGNAEAFAMALQGDAKIVLVGHAGNSAAVVRLQGDTSGGSPAGRAPRVSSFTARVRSSGRSVSFVLRSDQTCRGVVSGRTVHAYAAARRQRVSLGSVRFRLTAGRSRTVVLTLSRTARNLLARRHSLQVQFTITLTNSAQQRRVSRRTVTLRVK